MKKQVHKLLDEKGRILIPKEFRQMTEMECGDIVKLSVSGGKIILSKVDIVEMGSQDPETMEAYVNAAVKQLKQSKYIHEFVKRKEYSIVGKIRRNGFSQRDVDRQWNQIVNMIRKKQIRTKKTNNKRFVRYSEGAEMYSMSVSKFMQLAKDAKACYKVNQLVLVNLDIIDEYLETFHIVDDEFYK